MKVKLLRLLFVALLVVVSQVLSAQVKLTDSGVTKVYSDGSRITYFEMQDFPNSAEMREFVKKSVLEASFLKRMVVYKDGKTCMYEADQSVEPDMVVDAINDVLQQYSEQMGEFPSAEVRMNENRIAKEDRKHVVTDGTVPTKSSNVKDIPGVKKVERSEVRQMSKGESQGKSDINSKNRN